MARIRYGLGTHPLLDDPHERYTSSRNNLAIGRTLEHALRRLDGIKRRIDKARTASPPAYADARKRSALISYAYAWEEEAADIDVDVRAHCHRDGSWTISQGFPCDGQLDERKRRADALLAHLQDLDEAYEAVIETCRQRGRYWDDRDIDTRTLVATIRTFLLTGGQLLLHPEPSYCPSFKADSKLLFGPGETDPDLRERHFVATREAYALERRWRAHHRIERIGRRLGRRLDNGWYVLKVQGTALQVAA